MVANIEVTRRPVIVPPPKEPIANLPAASLQALSEVGAYYYIAMDEYRSTLTDSFTFF